MLEFELGYWQWSGQDSLGQVGVIAQRAEPTHPNALKLIEYWESKRSGCDLPRWTDFHPRDIRTLLPWLLLVAPEGDDWRHRLFAGGLATRFGADWSGRLISEIYNPDTEQECRKLYAAVACDRQPIHLRARYLGLGIEHKMIEAVNLPVLGRDEETVWVFVGAFFCSTALDAAWEWEPSYPYPSNP